MNPPEMSQLMIIDAFISTMFIFIVPIPAPFVVVTLRIFFAAFQVSFTLVECIFEAIVDNSAFIEPEFTFFTAVNVGSAIYSVGGETYHTVPTSSTSPAFDSRQSERGHSYICLPLIFRSKTILIVTPIPGNTDFAQIVLSRTLNSFAEFNIL